MPSKKFLCRSKYELLMSSFPNIKSQLSQQRDDLQKLSSALQHQRSSFPEECGRVQNMVISSCTEIIKGITICTVDTEGSQSTRSLANSSPNRNRHLGNLARINSAHGQLGTKSNRHQTYSAPVST